MGMNDHELNRNLPDEGCCKAVRDSKLAEYLVWVVVIGTVAAFLLTR